MDKRIKLSEENFRTIAGWLTLILLAIGSFAQAQQQEKVIIRGEVVGLSDAKKIYLQRYYNKMFFVIDSSTISAGKFSFHTKLTIPELYGIAIDTTVITPLYVFVDSKKELFVQYDTANYRRNSIVKGSASTDRFRKYQQNAKSTNIETFIKEDPASIVSAFVLYRYFAFELSASDIEKYTNLLDPSLANTQYVQLLKKLPGTLRGTGIGTKAPDFSLPDPEGKVLKLSDHFGKYLLVDFWAAWCGPCRRENPNLVRVFNQYKHKGFSVFSVSLDRSKDAWVKAIQKDGLIWPQVSDLRFWESAPAKLYGIREIPGNVLLDPSGKIIGRNLHGEALEKRLAEVLN